jgi:hypothetical protein
MRSTDYLQALSIVCQLACGHDAAWTRVTVNAALENKQHPLTSEN